MEIITNEEIENLYKKFNIESGPLDLNFLSFMYTEQLLNLQNDFSINNQSFEATKTKILLCPSENRTLKN